MNTSYKKSNFGAAFFFISKEKRAALARFYEFCRIVDDIADEPNDDPKAALNFWRAQLETPTTALAAALARDIKTYNINKQYFYDIIDGMEMDLNKTSYRTMDELKIYMYRVASAVGLVCIAIFGSTNKEYAVTLGYAVQLTNIIRDVRADASLGRVYLPEEDRAKFPSEKDLLAHETAVAENFYAQADALMTGKDRRVMFPARVMGAIYRQILAKIKSTGYNIENKVRLSKFEKFLAVIKAL